MSPTRNDTLRTSARGFVLGLALLLPSCVPTEAGTYNFYCNDGGCIYLYQKENPEDECAGQEEENTGTPKCYYDFDDASAPCDNGGFSGTYTVYQGGATHVHCNPPPPSGG